jgi:hypothetical protein
VYLARAAHDGLTVTELHTRSSAPTGRGSQFRAYLIAAKCGRSRPALAMHIHTGLAAACPAVSSNLVRDA